MNLQGSVFRCGSPCYGRAFQSYTAKASTELKAHVFSRNLSKAVNGRLPAVVVSAHNDIANPAVEASAASLDATTTSDFAGASSTSAPDSNVSASLTRTIVSAPTRHVAGLLSGPMSVLLGFVVAVAATVAVVRAYVARRVRNCQSCKGYGVARCALCNGEGVISWEGKFVHEELCPVCLGKRHTRCGSCGGGFNRPVFQHSRPVALEQILQPASSQPADPITVGGNRILKD
mmetsp:Transcript_23349/g.55867  ORF Transcript_23349/g.55867 Transcript_23349/m.55867 type:complete len:232 (+) Transcript_23349:134-829(+)